MIDNKTVFSYVLPSTGNLVEYRGLYAKYSSYELDALDAAVLVRLGTSSGSFPSSQAVLGVYDTSGRKYLINGWPGSQADNLNFVGVDGNQYYLSNRFINTGTAVPSSGSVTVNFRCKSYGQYQGSHAPTIDHITWEWYTGSTIQPVLATAYSQTGVEYRVYFQVRYLKPGGYYTTALYLTRSTTKNSWIQWDAVGGTNIAISSSVVSWVAYPTLQRNINGTWTNVGELQLANYSSYTSITSGTISLGYSIGSGSYSYGATMGSSGTNARLCIYEKGEAPEK